MYVAEYCPDMITKIKMYFAKRRIKKLARLSEQCAEWTQIKGKPWRCLAYRGHLGKCYTTPHKLIYFTPGDKTPAQRGAAQRALNKEKSNSAKLLGGALPPL